ncbi:MAG: indole-3-glycerol phosphate synthase TrpC [Clostridiales bacterium]|jgi:indole-3-glycerol phosphate synthase|nr:indole-3-glycerol phosphate synthase TrpC [Clostridiales bacterium]
MTILDTIAKSTRKRVEAAKRILSLAEIKRQAEALPADTGFPFEKALAAPGLSFICEVKRASPSKGLIAADFPYLQIAREYEAAGAAAVSVLTEPEFFLGEPDYLREIARAVKIPALRKDFIVDEYQIYEAKAWGASAVLLICALLPPAALAASVKLCDRLGLSALVEAHTEGEVSAAVQADARVIGVNNRDLKTFTVDLNIGRRLRPLIPPHALFVSESGIHTADDVRALTEIGADAALIGEAMMRAADKGAYLERLRAI